MPVRVPESLRRFFSGPPNRGAGSHFRRLDAAAGGRRAEGIGTFGPVNSEIGAGRDITMRRARYLASNNPFISNAVGNWSASLVGTGLRANPKGDEGVRRAAAQSFDAWAREADIAERTDFYGLQNDVARHMAVDGEACVAMLDEPDGLRLQAIPPEQIDSGKTVELPNGGVIVQGVEFDARGRRVAYHIFPNRPHAEFEHATQSVRYSAADILHIFKPISAGQVRGLSWLAPIVVPASDFDGLMDALLVKSKTQAMFAGFLTDLNANAAQSFDGDAPDGIMETGLEPGTLKVLPPGVDIKFSDPDAARDAPAFIRTNLLALAAGLGLPEHLLSGDLANANYSSLRAGLLPFRQRVEQIQYGVLVPQLLRPVWRRWLALEIASGRLDLPADLEAEWIAPRPMQVDPEKDIKAVREALALGLMSRSQAINELGWNADDLDAEIAADRERESALGLKFSSNLAGGPEVDRS